jgi:dihydrofolate reductase
MYKNAMLYTMKSIIVAYENNRVIGANGALPWQGQLPADMRHFCEQTTGNTVIMGRTTYESIGRPLPERQNIVISRMAGLAIPQVIVVGSLIAAFNAAEHEAFVIGGGQIYREALEQVDTIHATEIDANIAGDVTFPVLDSSWREVGRDQHANDDKNAFNYSYATYKKYPD